MATEYVDAGQAMSYSTLSTSVGKAPPVASGLTHERILNARSEPQNWLTYYGAYDGQRYSTLDQINKENVGKLVPQWVFQAGSMGLHSGKSTYGFEVSPIIVDGIMYISGWDGQCWAVDAAQGNELWRYKHASPFDVSLCCGNVNRGVAVAQGLVFMTTLNAHIIALDAETGKKVWDQPYGDVRAGESATVAPLIVKDMVIVGSSGGEFGNRGHSDAFKFETGERVWRTYMVPKPGEPGFETWPDDGEAWARGGANCWITPTYDPTLNLLYYGTGNPCPDFDGEDGEDQSGYVSAYDPRTAQERWRWTNDLCMCSSLLATGGDLVFGGEPTGEFNAWDANSGDLLWQFQCGSGHHSSPSTYTVDGRQFVVAPSGWGGWAEGFLPKMLGSSHGSALFAFALPE